MARESNRNSYRYWVKRAGLWVIRIPLWFVFCWCVLAIWFDFPILSVFTAMIFAAGVIRRALTARSEWGRLGWVSLACLPVIFWWSMIPPSNNRQWNTAGKILAIPEFDGDKVIIRNIRNFKHIDKNHFEPDYYDATFDLNDLEAVDLIFDHFLGEGPVSHTMLSFCFKNNRFICLTIEPRREEGEPYSIPCACFKGFEIIYYLGDERDIIYQCTNILEQDIHLYRLNLTNEEKRHLCENVLRKAANLASNPEWYHFLTNNCTNNLLWLGHARKIDWREPGVVLNGFGAKLVYDRGYLADHLPFDELKNVSQIKAKAIKAGYCPDFSVKIREGLVTPSTIPKR